jgi:dihydroflavonol-4-reductase
VWDEEDWNTTSSLTEGPYRYSKYLAEKAAWDWWKVRTSLFLFLLLTDHHQGKEDQVKLLTVNPCFVLGAPRHKRADGVSITTMINLLNGKTKEAGKSLLSSFIVRKSLIHTGCGVNCFGIADNRNVAQAHVACVENENASGRHLVSSTVGVPFLEYAQVLRVCYFISTRTS